MPYAILRKSADQSVPNSTITDVSFDTEDADVGGLHAGSDAHVTLDAGVWLMIAIVSFETNGSGYRFVMITEGSSDIAFGQNSNPGTSSIERVVVPIIRVVPSNGTQYKVRVQQTSGGNLGVLGNRSTYFMVYQLA